MADATAPPTDPPATVDDWTRVDAGTYHDFHQTWIPQLKLALLDGILPPGYYAHVERSFGSITAAESESDLLTLDSGASVLPGDDRDGSGGGTAVLDAPPRTAVSMTLPKLSRIGRYAARADRLAIKRGIDHRVVALLEVASPGNKDRRASVDRLVAKLATAVERGVNVVLVDLLPPGAHDPAGLNGAVLDALGQRFDPPPDKPLCAAGYRVGSDRRAYVEPLAVGDSLPTVPLFLSPDRYVDLPLGPSYAVARRGVGPFWVEVLEGRRDRPA